MTKAPVIHAIQSVAMLMIAATLLTPLIPAAACAQLFTFSRLVRISTPPRIHLTVCRMAGRTFPMT